jgi:hypothetical protein
MSSRADVEPRPRPRVYRVSEKASLGAEEAQEINEDLLLHRDGRPDCVRHDGRHCHSNETANFSGLGLVPI